jgi:HSP20 family protein
MGIIEKVTSLLPRHNGRPDLPPVGGEVLALRDNLDRWLDRFFEAPWGLAGAGDFGVMPRVNVDDTEEAVIVSVDVPGFDREDLDLSVTPESLTIRGETGEASQDRRKPLRVAEERYERFTQVIPLPPGLDIDRAQARVSRGRLTVTFPKTAPASSRRQIPIRT